MWDLPRPGLEPVSPALAGRFSTAAPPGKPSELVFNAIPYTETLLFFKTDSGGEAVGAADQWKPSDHAATQRASHAALSVLLSWHLTHSYL